MPAGNHWMLASAVLNDACIWQFAAAEFAS
jgi:hypothetical protein